jgi:hypothetical protein
MVERLSDTEMEDRRISLSSDLRAMARVMLDVTLVKLE